MKTPTADSDHFEWNAYTLALAGLRRKIEKAAADREMGQTVIAATVLAEAISQARELEAFELMADGLQHRIVCYKHMYQKTGNREFLNQMDRDCWTGISLSIPEEKKAGFHLRHGDVMLAERNYLDAEAAYRRARAALLPNDRAEAEYLGHLAECLTLTGKTSEAITTLLMAFDKLKRASRHYQPDHLLIVRSGLNSKLVKAALADGKRWMALKAFIKGYAQAWTLRQAHRKPMRLKQYHDAFFRKSPAEAR